MTHSYAYDEFGRIARSDRSGNAADMEYSYDDMHGWLTETESHGGFKQTLYHENADKNPRYNGSIAAMSWEVDDSQKHTYHYKYDELNRLVAADYSLISYSKGIGSLDKTILNKDIDAIKDIEKQKLIPRIDLQRYDYSVSYEYDRNCNITELRRRGTTNSAKGQVIDNLDFGYSGNQLRNVTDDADVTLTYAGAFDFQDKADKGVEYSYNENGAMTQDLNKGIKNVEYDLLGYPRKVTFSDGNSIVYVYAADGRKLREVRSTTMSSILSGYLQNGNDLGTSIKPKQGKEGIASLGSVKEICVKDSTDYVNAYVFKNNKPYMFNFQDGYYSFDDNGKYNGYHLYVKDYQGNIRLVVNGETDSIEQVNHYYPYGALMGDISTSQDFQKYKYSGKELDRQFGLDWYDFHARQYDPLVPGFNGVDKKSEEFYWVSPYAYCLGNPVNCIDPDGRKVVFAKGVSSEFQQRFGELVQYMKKCGTSGDLARLQKSSYTYEISEAASVKDNVFTSDNGKMTISINLNEGIITNLGIALSPATCAAHEFGHASYYDKVITEGAPLLSSTNNPKNKDSQYDSKEEKRNIETTEQIAAQKHGEITSEQTTRRDHKIKQTTSFTTLHSFEEISQMCKDYNVNVVTK